MSSFWSSIRGRRDSNSVRDSEGNKPPSGRSSISKGSHVSKIGDEKLQREDSDEKTEKGCLNISCLSGQSFPCKALSTKLLKVPKTGSSPRKNSDFPPTPLPTPETDSMVFPDLSIKPMKQDSPKPKQKYFKKRAASSSPSRWQGEKHRTFRGISRERLIAPLPAPLRKLFSHRQTQSKPDISLDANYPAKPLRKPGPLGRSWVKVYKDITYVDDISEDSYPILGHSGYPVKVPEAVPLPKPPTPPPQKIKVYDITVENIKSQKDALRKKQVLRDINRTSELALNHNEVANDEVTADISNEVAHDEITTGISNEVAHVEEKADISSDTIDFEIIKKNELNIVLSKIDSECSDVGSQADEKVRKHPVKIERPSRNREAVRHKAKRAKRSGTPIGAENMLPSPEEVAAAQIESSSNTSEEVMDNEYIIPQNLSPMKPPRVNKVCENIAASAGDNDLSTENTDIKETVDKDCMLKFNENHSDVESSSPYRPKRGTKTYDSISRKISNEVAVNNEQTIEDKAVKAPDIDEEIRYTDVPPYESNDPIIIPPHKPKRKQKTYENVDNFCSCNELPNALRDIMDNGNNDNVMESPLKPFRGRKVYANSGKVKTLQEKPSTQILPDSPDANITTGNSNGYSDNKENIDLKSNKLRKHHYATVCKDRLSKELREVIPYKDNCDSPPPIPPKKKDMKSIESITPALSMQPFPPRTLLSKTRSAETSPCRPTRKRLIAQINNESLPARPRRYTKVYTELQIIRNTNFKRRTGRKDGYNSNTIGTEKRKPPSREFRQSCPLPPPPRPQKSPAVNRKKEVQSSPHIEENTANITPLVRSEIIQGSVYNPLIKSSSTRRNRPPPPPPPTTKGKLHDAQNQQTSRNDIEACQEVPVDNLSTQLQNMKNSNFITEIAMNQPDIEHASGTLDSVFHSQKSYADISPAWSNDPPAWSHDNTKRRHSCEVVCDQIFHSNSSHKSTKNEVTQDNLCQSAGFDSPNPFSDIHSNKTIQQEISDVSHIKNQFLPNQENRNENDTINNEKVSDLEISESVEFQVSIPSIIPVVDKDISIGDITNKLSCTLNIEPITANFVDRTAKLEKMNVDTTISPNTSINEPQTNESSYKETETQIVIDGNNKSLDSYECEIKEISKGLNNLRDTLERCDSNYMEDAHRSHDDVVVGTLLLGGSINDKEEDESIKEMKSSELQRILVEDKAVVAGKSINIHGLQICTMDSENVLSSNEELEKDQIEIMPFLESNPPSYSSQEILTKNCTSSKENKNIDTNISEASVAIDRIMETVSTKNNSHLNQSATCEEIQKEATNQNNNSGPEISDVPTSNPFKTSLDHSTTPDSSSKQPTVETLTHDIDNENERPDCHISNIVSTNDQDVNEDDSSEEVSEQSSCTVEEVKIRSEAGQHTNEVKTCKDTTKKCKENTKDVDISWIVVAATKEEMHEENTIPGSEQEQNTLQIDKNNENKESKNDNKENPSASDLLHGVADITGKLEGIRSQLEHVVSNFIPPVELNDSSFDYTSSESQSSSISNRSSLTFDRTGSNRSSLTFDQTESNRSSLTFDQTESNRSSLIFDQTESNRSSLSFDQTESSSNASYYSLSQPSLSNYSLLSYYTARSTSPALSESPTNTPTFQSPRAEYDESTEPEEDDHC